MSIHIALLFLLALPALTIEADTTAHPDTTIAAAGVLSEVVITAARMETTLATAPSRVTVLSIEAVRQTGAHTVADLLEDRSGAFLRRYGPSGLATLSLRGASSSQSVILLDGRRITPPQIGVFDLSLLPTVLLESVEIMHGAASPLYGSDGMGGAVNIRTVQPTADATWRASATYGAYGERIGSALLSLTEGRVSTTGAVEYATAKNDFPYLNRARFPAETMRRGNADRQRISAFTSTRLRGKQHALRISTWYDDSERGLPGLATAPSTQERQWDRQFRVWADAERRIGRGTYELRALLQHTTIRYQHTGQDIDQTGRALLGALEAEGRRPIGATWVVAGGAGASLGRAAHPSLADHARQQQGHAFLHGRGHIGPLLAYPALRLDGTRSADGAFTIAASPRLGLNIALWEQIGLYGKASTGRTFRTPTLNDRFWQPGGNPDLQPEYGWASDAGLFLQRRTLRAELTAFMHRVKDQIAWRPTGEGYWSPINISRVYSVGMEASLQMHQPLASWAALDAGIFYTITRARDRSNPGSSSYNRQLRYVPGDALKSHVTLTTGPLAIDLNGHYTGRRFITTDERQYLDFYVVVNAQARVTHILFGLQAHLGLLLENLFDTEYAVLAHHPMPPRHARVLLSLEPQP